VKRKTLDKIFAGGGLLVAALLATLGFAMGTQYAFATDYVREELAAQKITFSAAADLTDADKNWKPGSACLVTYAGQPLTTGAQAECYAKYYIAAHMHQSAERAGFPGATYATLGATRAELSAEVAAAKTAGNTAAAEAAQKRLDAATSLRASMQTGETLRGLLLTVYGFSVLGGMAGLASNLLYGLAALMFLLSIAGFIHAFRTPEDEVVFTAAPARQPTTSGA